MSALLTQYDWLHALAGLGFFLLGMGQLEKGLEELGGRRFKRFLREHTRSTVESVFSGTAITAILQSSSLVSLIVLAFVGAGVLELRNAVGIILGANLGTTITGWLAAIFGFKVDIADSAFYLTGAGALAHFFGRMGRLTKKLGAVALGFGLLFMGLAAMKDAAEQLSQSTDLTALADYPMIFFFFASIILTAAIRSSSAMVVITLNSLAAGAINLDQALVIVIGADLGTTATVIMGAIKGSADKKRVAAAHWVINIVTVILALLFRQPIVGGIDALFGVQDPLILLVAFHSTFNLLGVFVFLPVIGPFTTWLQRHFRQVPDVYAQHIGKVPVDVADAALAALAQEAKAFWLQIRRLNFAALPWDEAGQTASELQVPVADYSDAYRVAKQWEGEISDYALALQRQNLDTDEIKTMAQLMTAVRSAAHAAKCLKDIKGDFDQLAQNDRPTLRHLLKEYGAAYVAFDAALHIATQQAGEDDRFRQLAALFSQNQEQYDRLTQLIYDMARRGELGQGELSTMLNITRELYSAQKSLLLSAKDAFLGPTQAEAIVNVPLVHRPL